MDRLALRLLTATTTMILLLPPDAAMGQPVPIITQDKNLFFDRRVSGPESVAFSSDGNTFAAGVSIEGTSHGIFLWHLPTTKLTDILRDHSRMIRLLRFSSQSEELFASYISPGLPEEGGDQCAVKRWDWKGGKQTGLHLLPGTANLAFSPDCKWLVTVKGYPNAVAKVWEVASGNEVGVLDCGPEIKNVNGAVFSPDGKQLAVSGPAAKGRIFFWSCATFLTKTKVQEVEGKGAVLLAFSPKGDVLAYWQSPGSLARGEHRGGIQFLDLNTGKRLPFSVPRDSSSAKPAARDFAFAPDGKAVAITAEDGVDLFAFPSGKKIAFLAVKSNLKGRRGNLVFSPDGNLVAVAAADGVFLWNIKGLRDQ